jgi:hypothetical protein
VAFFLVAFFLVAFFLVAMFFFLHMGAGQFSLPTQFEQHRSLLSKKRVTQL